MTKPYLTDLRLGEIEMTLVPRDRQILVTLRSLRYMRTNQVQRLFFFSNHSTPRASLTAATKNLNRLKSAGLITPLEKRIGGVRTGSLGLVWHITEGGVRLLELSKGQERKRINAPDPSPMLLRHTLAVTECYIQFTEICRMADGLNLKVIDVEPQCWRTYQKDGKTLSLRPDLYAEIENRGYVDSWFVEMDLDTETVQDIVEKCRRYQHYCQTNQEQQKNGVFPLVLWIVPTEERRKRIMEAIRFHFGSRYPQFHLVITPNALWNTLTEGAKKEDLC